MHWDVTAVIAIYGAVISTVLAGAKFYAWIDSRRTKVSLSLGRYGTTPGATGPLGVTVRITNRSRHIVHPVAGGFGSRTPEGSISSFLINDDRVPSDVGPGETLHFNIRPDELRPEVLDRPFIAWVRLSDGTIVEGKRARPLG
jgi:hypothetical protein